ncbi:MAG: hypothetical protein CMK07_06095 [Ponticaulis sp.]|nr:hypothetical protein [Ponticaulis sp.]
MSATDIASSVRAGRLHASDVVAETLKRIAKLDPLLICFTNILKDQALESAAKIDAAVAAGDDPGPLAGVPFAVKDLFDVEGLTTTAGSFILRDAPPASSDAKVVERLKAAGAILIGTLNMDEFAYGFATVNMHYGTTRNPHDTSRLAGGSSGGSAASVAAGLVPLSLGSDTNGSVRVPASLCGIFGLRPTHGAITIDGTFPFVDRLDTVGLFTRSVDDLRTAYAISSDTPETSRAPKTPKAGLLTGWFQSGGQQDVLDAARNIFEALGGTEEINLPLTEAARSAGFILTASEGGQRHLPNLRTRPMDFDPAVRDRLIAGALLPDSVVNDADALAAIYIDQLLTVLEDFDVLIAPSTPSTAPDIAAGLIEIDGQMVSARANLGLYAQPIALAGVPVLSVPLKRDGQLPVGVQLIAARGREALLFDLADQLVASGRVAVELPELVSEVA